MDYEKKYNEALERAQKATRAGGDVAMDIIQYIFPELRESEDERTRTVLCDIVRDMPYMETELRAHGLSVEKTIAYLEKQKEQNLIMAKSPQLKGQKPAEWSEEDEKMVRSILFVLESYVSKAECEQNPALTATYPTYYKEIDWLKSLRPQPKQEWNTYDKAAVTCIACCLDGQFVTEAARKQALEWFNKHRRDFLNRPSWKPSEEQMDRLFSIVAALRKDYCDDMADAIAEIYHGLEKLM